MTTKYILLQDAVSRRGKKKVTYAKAGDQVTLFNAHLGIAFVEASDGNKFTVHETQLKVADPTDLKTR